MKGLYCNLGLGLEIRESINQKSKLQGIGFVLVTVTESWPYKKETDKITHRRPQILKIILSSWVKIILKSLALAQSPSPKAKPWAKAFH